MTNNSGLPYLKAPSKAAAVLRTGPAVTVIAEPYEYTRLASAQIRLLSISIEPSTGYVTCHFRLADLATSRGAFRAISYCWGKHTPTHRVLCEDGRSLLLTESATELLRYVIPRNPVDYFWIDQICVNQADLEEKSTQVSLMGQIYSLTTQVVAWLGRGNRSSEHAIKFVEALSEEVSNMKRKGLDPTLVPLLSESARVHNAPAQMQTSHRWNALSNLLKNVWFERVWVMQEVIMACAAIANANSNGARVLLSFEKCSIDFDLLAMILDLLERDHLLTNMVYDRLNQDSLDELGVYPRGLNATRTFSLFRDIRSRGEPIMLNLALDHAWHFKATNARDKIYAVLAFADEPVQGTLRPNYALTVEEIYTVWTTELLERPYEYPMMLHMAGIGLQRTLCTLPSWVPDLDSASPTAQLAPVMTKSTGKVSMSGRAFCPCGAFEIISIISCFLSGHV